MSPASPLIRSRTGLMSEIEVAVQRRGRLELIPRKQMPIAVERERDGGMAHVCAQRLDVDASRDHQRGEGVATLVKGDRLKPGPLPGDPGTLCDRRGIERPLAGGGKGEALAPAPIAKTLAH